MDTTSPTPGPRRIHRRWAAVPGALGTALVALAFVAGPVAAVSYATPAPTASAAPTPAGSASPMTLPASLSLGSGTTALGAVLTGPDGRTLYTLSSDPNGGSVCTGQCLVFWPPLLVAAGGSVSGPSTVTGTFATFVRADDGTTQVALDGRALYFFKNDTAPGQTNGEGIKSAGGVWHVALAAAAAASPTAIASPTATATAGVAGAVATPRVTIPPTSTSPDGSPTSGGTSTLTVLLAILVVGAIAAGSRFAMGRGRR